MVTKMSPARIVGMMMGAWFLSIAMANYLAGIIATFTGVSEEGGDKGKVTAATETVLVYGDVFIKIAIASLVAGLLCFALSPMLTRWMHMDKLGKTEEHFTDAHEEIA